MDREYARVLGLSERTLTRHKGQLQKRLGLVESDRLYRMAWIFALAQEVLEDDRHAIAWLRRPQIGLSGRTPLDMLRTEAGAREVEDPARADRAQHLLVRRAFRLVKARQAAEAFSGEGARLYHSQLPLT